MCWASLLRPTRLIWAPPHHRQLSVVGGDGEEPGRGACSFAIAEASAAHAACRDRRAVANMTRPPPASRPPSGAGGNEGAHRIAENRDTRCGSRVFRAAPADDVRHPAVCTHVRCRGMRGIDACGMFLTAAAQHGGHDLGEVEGDVEKCPSATPRRTRGPRCSPAAPPTSLTCTAPSTHTLRRCGEKPRRTSTASTPQIRFGVSGG